MGSAKESYSARFVGRKLVQGPLNDVGLSLLVADLQGGGKAGGGSNRSQVCAKCKIFC